MLYLHYMIISPHQEVESVFIQPTSLAKGPSHTTGTSKPAIIQSQLYSQEVEPSPSTIVQPKQ